MRMAKVLGTLAEALYHDFYSSFPKEGDPTNPARP